MKKQIAVLVSALLMGGGTYAQNGAQAQKPKAYMVSDAHLDTQWNWDIQTTIGLCMEHDQSEFVSAEAISGIHL